MNKADKYYHKYLLTITGRSYTFANASHRKWDSEHAEIEEGNFFQLMPYSLDSTGFFDWYCDERPYNQFFRNKHEAVLEFVKYWLAWKGIIKIK